jgi:predicted phage tail protein
MKKIKLLGDLQAFKAEWELLVDTPGEAMRAIEANRPGFLRACSAGDYVLILYDEANPDLVRQVTMLEATQPWADEVLIVVPKAGGDIPVPFIVAAFAFVGVTLPEWGALLVTALVNVAVVVAVSAIANVITSHKQKVDAKDTETPENKPSFVSNGPVNVVRQGHPYPIIAGEFLCGSIVVSSQVHIQDIPI